GREGFDPDRRTVLASARRIRGRALDAGEGSVMRGGWLLLVVIVAGAVALTGVVALVGRDDSEDQTVPAGEWADTVCGAVAVWRGQIEAIADGLHAPDAR